MQLYSVQSASHWREAKIKGLLTGGATIHHVDPAWRHAYEWMRLQMKAKLGWVSGDYPVWAWMWERMKEFKPDTRWGEVGQEMVLLGFGVPTERVLLSDFLAWHVILNNDTISEDDRHFTEEEKVDSWQRIFNPADLGPEWGDGTLQACVDRVFPHEVFHVQEFVIEKEMLDESNL